MKVKFLFITIFCSTFAFALTSTEINQNLNNINKKIHQVNVELVKQQDQQQNIDNAIKYSDSALHQSGVLLRNIKRQKDFSLQQLSEIQSNLDSLNQSLDAIQKQTNTTINMIYQQIQRLKLQNQSIISGNNSLEANRKKTYLLTILQDEQNKLLTLKEKIKSLNAIHEKLQAQIDRLNKRLNVTNVAYKQLQTSKKEQMAQSEMLHVNINKSKSKLNDLQSQQNKLNQLMDSIIAKEQKAAKQKAKKKNNSEKKTSITKSQTTDNEAGYEDNSSFLSSKYVKPVDAAIALGFGQTRDNVTNKGVLFNYLENAPVKAIANGKTMYSGDLPGFGKVIIIDHGNNYMSIYGGVLAKVKVGDHVDAGQIIANTGNKENQPMGGLYFELRHLGKPINPNRIVN